MPGANDTIAAIATPPGRGGVGVVRLSGPQAKAIGQKLFKAFRSDFAGPLPYRLHHGRLLDASGREIDDILLAFMPGPGSYTGEDVVEFHCHGSPAVLRGAVSAARALGARSALPGEFTKRAFMNGKLDLSQAQAVAELIASDTGRGAALALERLSGLMGRRVGELRRSLEHLRAQLCLAVDFPEEELECLDPGPFCAVVAEVMAAIGVLVAAHGRARPFREGALAVLAGPVNAGKSSLLNALLGRERAIVSDIPGTTRDFLEEQLDLDGLPLRLADTAGLRETGDHVELQGLARCRALLAQADVVLLVADGSRNFDPEAFQGECGLGAPDAARAGQAPIRASTASPVPLDPASMDPAPMDPARILAVVSKADLPRAAVDPAPAMAAMGFQVVRVSARTGEGLEDLCAILRERILGGAGGETGTLPDDTPVPNARECGLLSAAQAELAALNDDVQASVPPDLLGVRLESACAHLADITGEITPDAVLTSIFENFCIGK